VVEDIKVDSPKTKLLADQIKGFGFGAERVLIITDSIDENLYLSSRNLPNVLVLEAHQADPVSLVRFNKVLMTRNAITKIEEVLV
jgi:large subunit ribosomal protein L4